MTKLVIIGLGSGGFAALLSAKKFNSKAEITVIDEKSFDLLHPCGLPYALEEILPMKNLKHDINAERMNVKMVKGKAVKIDVKNKKIITDNKKEIEFDSLIIAIGAKPFIPPIKGIQEFLGKTVFTVHSLNDAELINASCIKEKNAVVIGAGAIGLETAIALNKRGLKVKIIEAMPNVLSRAMDKDMVSGIEEYLKEKGIELLLGKKVEEIKEKSVIAEGQEIECDLIVLSAGIKPNIELAKESGITLGEKAVKVNEFMQTNFEEIYAVGDLVEVPNMINEKKLNVGLANSAYLQGLIAGRNALGAKEKYAGTALTFVTVLGALEIASTGFTKEFAESQGIKVIDARIKGKNKYDWFPGAKELTVKVLINEETKKIIGAQAVGKDAYVRINIVSTAIKAGMTLDELLGVELAYCPPISEAYDVLLLACEMVKRKMN
ncbi:MAG: FAD-dependent oxidoreductase [Candidatus Diapherotrites archaeon]